MMWSLVPFWLVIMLCGTTTPSTSRQGHACLFVKADNDNHNPDAGEAKPQPPSQQQQRQQHHQRQHQQHQQQQQRQQKPRRHSSRPKVPPQVPLLHMADGQKMPQIGMGVYRAVPGQETYLAVQWALQVGYRLIDTAMMYNNQFDVGRAVADSGIPRDQIFLTTKLDTNSHGYTEALQATDECLRALQTDYLDLLLIHSPFGGKLVETWDAMIQLQADGKVKSIGVSNFGVDHLQVLKDHGRPMPVVNQIELHPLIYNDRKALLLYCQQNYIRITAYGSLFSGYQDRYEDTMLQYLARKYKKTVPQILLRWALDNDFAVIPKSSSSKERVQENFDILDFKLAPEEIKVMNEMPGPPLDEYWNPVLDATVDVGDTSHGVNRNLLDEL